MDGVEEGTNTIARLSGGAGIGFWGVDFRSPGYIVSDRGSFTGRRRCPKLKRISLMKTF